ncbi:hypothetical protein ABZU76_26465 [Amycolatopsis sp. NPDC005232]|uniref:hypothetical protein n=1 Tax=Amycolatopsis sp. NPDC005232 TaxID=3157027 RepID=UPI0033A1D02A
MTETQENPLVATAEPSNGLWSNMGTSKNELDNLNPQTAGSGALNDAASTLTDIRNHDWFNVGVDAVTDGLDILGALIDPLGTLAAAGVGWLIEHISFLKDFLDQLAGNPEEITAKAVTWTNVSKQLTTSAGQYEQAAANVAPEFQSAGGQAYQNMAKGYVATLRGAAGQAQAASVAMNVAGALVGTERGLIRDMISSFIGNLIIKALAALASSWFTFGGTIAAFIADAVVEGGILAEKISTRIAQVVEKLDKLAQSAGKAKGAIEEAAKILDKLGKTAGKISDKSLDAAVSIEKKANNLKETGAAWDKLTDAEKAAKVKEKAEGWKDGSSEKVPGHDFLDTKVKPFTEPGRSFLNPEEWEKAGGDMPKWTPTDTLGAGEEARRQENEQRDRSKEASEAYENEHKGEGGEGGGEGTTEGGGE